jgi:hypothetical protein
MSCWRRDATEDRRWRCSSCGELIRVKPWPPQISHRWCMHVGNLIHARLHQCGPVANLTRLLSLTWHWLIQVHGRAYDNLMSRAT